MKRKDTERLDAIRLRQEGKSLKEIVDITGASKSSVSGWVRNVVLTKEQKAELEARVPSVGCQGGGCKARSNYALERRKIWQSEGREMAKRISDSNFIVGCALYWAEGSKGRNIVNFVNSDMEMMSLFVGFLRRYFDIKNDNMTVRLHFYSGNGVSLDDAVGRWLEKLGLEQESIRKSQVDVIRRDGYGKKKGKLPYGICDLRAGGTETVQQIFGAIQQLFGVKKDMWLT